MKTSKKTDAERGRAADEPKPIPEKAAGAPAAVPSGLSLPVRITMGAAALPSAASLIWAVWAIGHLVPAPWYVAGAAGVVLDLAWIGAVVIAWTTPAISRQAGAVAWVLAAIAAAAIALHAGWAPGALMAVTPLVSKALWHLVLSARRAAIKAREAETERARQEKERAHRRAVEEAAAAAQLTGALTPEQEAELADLKREAAYIRAKAEAKAEIDRARAEVEHNRYLEEIRRAADQAIAVDEADADIVGRRHRIEREIAMTRPLAALTTGGRDRDGAGLAHMHRVRRIAATTPGGAVGDATETWLREQHGHDDDGGDDDLGGFGGLEPTGPSGSGPAGGERHPSEAEARANRSAVVTALRVLGPRASNGELSRATGLSMRSIARHRPAAEQALAAESAAR
jgi:hypothetical protein